MCLYVVLYCTTCTPLFKILDPLKVVGNHFQLQSRMTHLASGLGGCQDLPIAAAASPLGSTERALAGKAPCCQSPISVDHRLPTPALQNQNLDLEIFQSTYADVSLQIPVFIISSNHYVFYNEI